MRSIDLKAVPLLLSRIPRDEVEEMGCVVMRELDMIESGCTSTIVGGYLIHPLS